MKEVLRKILLGDATIREYATISVDSEIRERVYLEVNNVRADVSENQWILCLDPAVFGIWLSKKEDINLPVSGTKYKMYFNDDSEKNAGTVAVLALDMFDIIQEDDGMLILLKLTEATSHHINFIKTLYLYQRHYKKPEQNFLKLKSFAAAYSYPRKVRLITFKEGDHFNIFPMDLVGDIPKTNRFVLGLRHTNITLSRIIQTGRIVVSEVPYQYKDVIYRLGKHHRGSIEADTEELDFIDSEIFKFPIPVWANSYKEIRIKSSKNLGSHMLLWGEEVNTKELNPSAGHLFHIHFLHYLHQRRRGMAIQLV